MDFVEGDCRKQAKKSEDFGSGCLAGSIRVARGSWSVGGEFEPHVGFRVYLNK